MEEKMVKAADLYVIDNSIYTDSEIYFDVNKLDVKLDDDCYLTSGVLFDGNNYIPNLMCANYQSKVIKTNDQIKDFITLKGDEVIVLAKGISYFEPGYISNDIVNTLGDIGTEEGVYNIYYQTTNSNSIARRKVIIIDDKLIQELFPVINLNGDEIIYLKVGDTYDELGINSSDVIDGDISNNLEILGNVDTSVIGEYYIDYVVTNSRGYKNSVTRKINVINSESDLLIDYALFPQTLTNNDVTIKLNTSSDYNHIIYPNGEEGKELEYIVKENGVYTFTFYDIYDRVIRKEIAVNNIDKTIPEGSCIATSYYNRTQIKVTVNTERKISSYRYFINGSEVINTSSNNYVSSITKPSMVKVILKDSINNQNEIKCTIEQNNTRKIVTDSKGKNCLEGMTCYVQFDYGNTSKYPFCSMSGSTGSCGGIGRSGCSITSISNALAMMSIKNLSGTLHNPYSVWSELYPINKATGHCNGGCSAWTRMREAIVKTGLTAPRDISNLSKNNINVIIEHLKKGYPVIVRAVGSPFSTGTAHYLTLIGINEAGNIFISDSANRSGIMKSKVNGKQYYVDTWISPNDLITGNVKEFLLIGPRGMFEGK